LTTRARKNQALSVSVTAGMCKSSVARFEGGGTTYRDSTQRNVLNAVPKRERAEVAAELVAICQQPSKQQAVVHLEAFKATYGKRYRGSGAKSS
jgi:hypothetical protein